LQKKPFIEAGFGVENIFKILRIDFLYRLTYADAYYKMNYYLKNKNFITPFSIKLSLGFGL
jgi:hypothetical protein